VVGGEFVKMLSAAIKSIDFFLFSIKRLPSANSVYVLTDAEDMLFPSVSLSLVIQ
jgi:hypothetical protein